jgi:hypothetical protein
MPARNQDNPPSWGRRPEVVETMKRGPLITKLMCVALVASVMMPLGREIYPYIESMLDSLQFNAVEAVISTTLGFAIYAAMFA